MRRTGRDEAVAGVSNAARRAAQVRLLEPVQHEDVAEGPEADAPQEAAFRCQVDNDGDDSCDNGSPPLGACDARVITERRQDEDQQNPRRHPHSHIANKAGLAQRFKDFKGKCSQGEVDDEDDQEDSEEVGE